VRRDKFKYRGFSIRQRPKNPSVIRELHDTMVGEMEIVTTRKDLERVNAGNNCEVIVEIHFVRNHRRETDQLAST
jgi:hypothetical protein